MNVRNLKCQLKQNVEYVLDEYLNGMEDYPEEYGEMGIEECRSYVTEQIYDLLVVTPDHVKYHSGICEQLKFLGNEYIYSVIDAYAHDNGILKEV